MAKNDTPFTDSINNQKNDRLARESLQELLSFNEALEHEIARLKNSKSVDQQMLQYMNNSKSLFDAAMEAMRTQSGEQGRLALIQFADSVQDMMGYIHKMRLH